MNKETKKQFDVGERLDKVVAAVYSEYSRAAIEKLIDTGAITVNGTKVKSKYIVKPDDVIATDFSELEKSPEHIELPIIYEDENVVVINKPIGVLSHSKGAFNKEGTVATWLKDHVYQHPELVEGSSGDKSDISTDTQDDKNVSFWTTNRAGIVHRLDRATSGVMICAKHEATLSHLGKQFSERNVKKTYIAVIKDSLPEEQGLIDVPIERNPKKPATFRPGVNGKPAQTYFKVLQTNEHYSLIELRPVTGRTHQLRVHLNYLKHPIVGDEFYSGQPADRLFLHAASLEITIPGGERKIFTAEIPVEFKEYVS